MQKWKSRLNFLQNRHDTDLEAGGFKLYQCRSLGNRECMVRGWNRHHSRINEPQTKDSDSGGLPALWGTLHRYCGRTRSLQCGALARWVSQGIYCQFTATSKFPLNSSGSFLQPIPKAAISGKTFWGSSLTSGFGKLGAPRSELLYAEMSLCRIRKCGRCACAARFPLFATPARCSLRISPA